MSHQSSTLQIRLLRLISINDFDKANSLLLFFLLLKKKLIKSRGFFILLLLLFTLDKILSDFGEFEQFVAKEFTPGRRFYLIKSETGQTKAVQPPRKLTVFLQGNLCVGYKILFLFFLRPLHYKIKNGSRNVSIENENMIILFCNQD